MLFSTFAAVFASVVAVSAQTQHLIVVGGNSTLTFSPTSVNASVGDTVAFQFQSKNHTVTQSTFAAPCANMTTPTEGIDSGFQAVAAGATSFPQWSFNVTNATTPLWFYCRQTGHCEAGMVFAVNPNAAKTFSAFQAAAMASSSSASAGGSASASATGNPSGSSGAAYPSASSTNANGAVRYSGSAAVALAVIGLSVAALL
ncbi:hypothetical protein FIBSPDRAFT_931845 [Athelia psychrophila]|uniref:Cupredoxin n=1 Tax=Athelia psychrophila TaxID=1759441 RepID=A0A166JUG2_9AGAM|nr:hypothetical protein FIBSPDRAFT_931845 [Fibularhizoctonia sp. CBS 109695]